MTNYFQLVTTGLISIGSASAIIFGLSSWLGKVWASRILMTEKNTLDLELTNKKAEYDREINSLKHTHDEIVQSRALAVDSKFAYEVHKEYLNFADMYIKKLREILKKLVDEGATEGAKDFESELRELRYEAFIYIPKTIDDELREFEYKLRVIGVNARLSSKSQDFIKIFEAGDKANQLLLDIVGSTGNYKDGSADILINMIKESFGISALNQILIESLEGHN